MKITSVSLMTDTITLGVVMSVESNTAETDPNQAYLEWLEEDIRDHYSLVALEQELRTHNPVLFNTLAEAAHSLSEGDPKAHATYFGSFLLLLLETKKI